MCARLTRDKSFSPGTHQIVYTNKGTSILRYGFGDQYNARIENLRYSCLPKGIVKVESFWEGGKEFLRTDGKLFNIAVVLNPFNEFAIFTTEPNMVVEPFHKRGPLVISDECVENYLQGKEYEQMTESYYKLAA